MTNNLMNDVPSVDGSEIVCENVPVVINNTNVFASENDNPTTSGTCTP